MSQKPNDLVICREEDGPPARHLNRQVQGKGQADVGDRWGATAEICILYVLGLPWRQERKESVHEKDVAEAWPLELIT